MVAIYGPRWVSAMGVSPLAADGSVTVAGETWSEGLADLTGDQFAKGLRSCLSSGDGWPPTLPEFRLACIGVPSIGEVRQNLRDRFEAYQPFTLMVYRRIDYWNYVRADMRQAERMLAEAYEEARAAVLRGEPLPEKPQLVTHEPAPPAPSDPEVGRRAIAEIREQLSKVTA
jgi:hypothetical protein